MAGERPGGEAITKRAEEPIHWVCEREISGNSEFGLKREVDEETMPN